MESILCIYHANCNDGIAAASIVEQCASKKGKSFLGWPAQYGDEFPHDLPEVKKSDIWIVDFSYPREEMEKILSFYGQLVKVFDHHETAEKELRDLPNCTFDNSKCGARLVWEAVHPDRTAPLIVQYVEDRDLWKWELENSKEVSAALSSYPKALDQWREFFQPGAIVGLIAEGKAILRYQQEVVATLTKETQRMKLAGFNVPAVNSATLQSEIGHVISEGEPFGVIYFDLPSGERVYSLRSADDGENVAAIAKQYGGGGHKHAAGFKVKKGLAEL